MSILNVVSSNDQHRDVKKIKTTPLQKVDLRTECRDNYLYGLKMQLTEL